MVFKYDRINRDMGVAGGVFNPKLRGYIPKKQVLSIVLDDKAQNSP